MNQKLLERLTSELRPAMGCTEPISICFASAKVTEVLGEEPDRISLQTSGSLYKNAKGVKIPNTGGLTGVKMSAIIGSVGGDAKSELEVLKNVTSKDIKKAQELLDTGFCEVSLLNSDNNIHVIIEAYKGENHALVEILDSHTNITKIIHNDKVIFEQSVNLEEKKAFPAQKYEDIFNFVHTIEIDKIEDIIEKQIEYNMKLVDAGFEQKCAHEVGRLLRDMYDMNDPFLKARANTAAASDARMDGVALPAMSNGGSGNQGITCSIPVYIYATQKGFDKEAYIRAVALSDLTFLYIKENMGLLSAYCSGIVSATAAAAAWMYLETKELDKIKQVIINTIGNISGIFCDGAKGSCTLKIASSLDAGILAFKMVENNNNIPYDDGIIAKEFERTIQNLATLARDGMKPLNEMIIDCMYTEELRE